MMQKDLRARASFHEYSVFLSEGRTPAGYRVLYYKQGEFYLTVLITDDNTYTMVYESPVTWLESHELIDFATYMESDLEATEKDQAAAVALSEQLREDIAFGEMLEKVRTVLLLGLVLDLSAFTIMLFMLLCKRRRAGE